MSSRPSTLHAYRSSAARGDSAFAWMARVGYAARGVVFMIIALFAALAALSSGPAVGTTGALRKLLAEPLGDILLWIIACGLLSFAGWRFFQATYDPDRCGRDMRGLARRTAFFGSSLIYLFLATIAVSVIFGVASHDDDKVARDWTAWLLGQPLGRWITIALGAAIVVGGLFQAVKPMRRDFRRELAEKMRPRRWMSAFAWIGYSARAVIFVMIGAFLVIAALHFNSGEAAGLGGALQALQRQTYGAVLLGLAAFGLFAFGALQIMHAAWRPIDVPTVKDVVAKAA